MPYLLLLVPLAACVLYLAWFLTPFLLAGLWVISRSVVRVGPGARWLDGPAYRALLWVSSTSPARDTWTRP